MLRFVIGSVMALGLVSDRWANAAGDELVKIGVARVDITPSYPVRLSGYMARSKESVGVSQKLWAKALAIGSDQQKPVVLVSVDNLGVGKTVVEEVARRLEKNVGLERSRFTVASSHTHCAPCLTDVAPNIFGKPIEAGEQATIDRYTRELTDAIERVSLDALKVRKPSRLGWAQGSIGFAANRRTKGGPVDHDMPVLRVTEPGGKPSAFVVNYACHCTTIHPNENTCSGDWAGYAQEAIEADHPDSIALTVVGCGADANPLSQYVPNAAVKHGRAIADEVKRLDTGEWTTLPGPPATAFERFKLPYDTLPAREDLQKLIKAGGPPGYNASIQLAKLDRGEGLPLDLDYSAQAWAFGDRLAMVFLPGEVVVDYALRIKKTFDAERLWVTAYANDVPCYIPSERILKEGGYEGGGAMVYYARPTRLKPGVEQVIMDGVQRVVPAGFMAPQPAPDMPPPLSPTQALQSFRLRPGFKVELVASEPLVLDPVAVDFGADGKLWVCEMRDYPTGMDNNWKPGGVIKYLEDTDADGRYDKATVLADDLPFPTGLMAWRKGVLVCAAPEILYLEDSDGDGKTDVRKVLYQGFATENYQARVNGLTYGLDNWVYGANGLIGGSIHGTLNGKSVDIGGRDFRFLPDSGVMEPASGLTQQGRVRDDWGNAFGGNNSVLIQQYPLPDHYSRRNPFIAAPSPAVYVPRNGDSSRLFPASETLARYNHPESANRVTSACSPLIYRDQLLGTGFSGNAFICEPVHNLVHREVVSPDGVTFAGRRADDEQDREFLGSTDHWFRPVQVRTGPDGALWVVDMYRFLIEHPRWISPERLTTLDVRAGADKGRIYRVYPENASPRRVPVLTSLAPAELAVVMDTPNGTIRDNVQRLVVERNDRAMVPHLAQLAARARCPEARAQALCTLQGLNALEESSLLAALKDPNPGVRAQAVRLSEPMLSKNKALGAAVAVLADDPVVIVRYQVALSLGEWDGRKAGEALARVALRDRGNRWVRAAVLSSARPHAATVLERVIAPDVKQPPSGLVEPLIATLVGAGEGDATARALSAVARPAADGGSLEPWRLGAVAEFLDTSKDQALIASPAVASVVAVARRMVIAPNVTAGDRLIAVRLLGRSDTGAAEDRRLLSDLIGPSQPVAVQVAAIRALSRQRNEESDRAVLDRWAGFGPAVRSAALDALLSRPESTGVVLAAVESGTLPSTAIDAAHRQRLLNEGLGEQKDRARAAFGKLAIGARGDVLKRFELVRTRTGEPSRGKAVFGRVCAGCHKVDGVGHEVGPDLAALTDTSVDAYMTAVLDPNREVDARYASYSAALADGRVVTGLIASETASAVTLKRQEGQSDVVLRSDLEELKTTGQSLMPEGLENDLKPEELADLIAYLAQGANRPKVLDGNRPALISAGPEGSVRLAATSAEIYGPTLTFETAFCNLGFWQNEADRAVWTFTTDRPATYTVSMEWACADESAGNVFNAQVDGVTLRGAVGGTGVGTWANYRSIFVGEATLQPGKHRLEFKSAGAVNNALLDLRAVVLTPRSGGVFRAAP